MAITSSSGIASGLNIEDIISKLMQVESKPLGKVKDSKSAYEQKVSAMGNLLNALSSLKTSVTPLKSASALGMKAVSTDNSILTATATDSALAGTYNIKVNSLAQSHGLYSTGYAAADSVVGTGTITIQVGAGTPVNISITSGEQTLTGISNAINAANAGVKSSVVYDGSQYKLALTANETGAANTIKLTVQDDDLNNTDALNLSALAYETGVAENMTVSRAAADASLVIDSVPVTRASNAISDLVSGVTINLKKDSAGSTIGLTVSKDTDGLKTKINSLVSAYNQAMTTVKGLKGTNAKKGALYNDSIVGGISNTLRSITTTTYGTGILANYGITHDKNGVLSVDSARLDAALASNPQGVLDTVNQMATSLETKLNDYINTFIPAKKDGYNSTVKVLERKEDQIERKLDVIEASLRKRFVSLEQTLSQLQGQSNYITQAFKGVNNK